MANNQILFEIKLPLTFQKCQTKILHIFISLLVGKVKPEIFSNLDMSLLQEFIGEHFLHDEKS